MTLSKAALRRQLNVERQKLSSLQQQLAARRLERRLLAVPALRKAQRIGFYASVGGELSPGLALESFRRKGTQCYLPVILPKSGLAFMRLRHNKAFRTNQFGIAEIRKGPRVRPRNLDAVIVPLVGFDPSGNRLGMGGGYYDRALAEKPRPFLIGIGHRCQQVDAVPVSHHDIALDLIISV